MLNWSLCVSFAGAFRGGIANGLDLADSRGRHLLLPDDVIDKYKEAIMHYSKVSYVSCI